MNASSIQAIILAAGKSTRFNTGRSKLLERLCGQEMILYTTKLFESLSLPTTVVLGYEAEAIKKIITDHHAQIVFAEQPEQKGTGHALACSQHTWMSDHILVINADMPLITKKIINELIEKHLTKNADVSFVTSHTENPSQFGYGRVIQQNGTLKIVEARDYQGTEIDDCCINAGIYMFKKTFLNNYLPQLGSHNAQNEFYLTDLIEKASAHQLTIETVAASFDHIRGVNTLKELWSAEQIKRAELISHWMDNGVRFFAAQAVHVDENVTIGQGSTISYGTHVINGTKIGINCHIEPFSIISNSTIGNNVTIYSHSVITDSTIEAHTKIGPFAHIRTHSTIKQSATVGNFVELKATTLGANSKAKHLAYLGDTTAGERVNIGAGTITSNHNGFSKQPTTIEDNAYIGSNNTLVAPLTIGKNSYTAAGSVITKQVPPEALAIARAYQVNKEGYARKLREKFAKEQQIKTNELKESEAVSFVAALKTHNDSTLSGNT